MKRFLILIFLIPFFTLSFSQSKSFLSQQQNYARVREAVDLKGDLVEQDLAKNKFKTKDLNVIYIVYKNEKEL